MNLKRCFLKRIYIKVDAWHFKIFGNKSNPDALIFLSVVSLLAALEKKDIELGFIDSQSANKLKNQSEIKVNFDILANVPLYKSTNQKEYNIIKLKNDEL